MEVISSGRSFTWRPFLHGWLEAGAPERGQRLGNLDCCAQGLGRLARGLSCAGLELLPLDHLRVLAGPEQVGRLQELVGDVLIRDARGTQALVHALQWRVARRRLADDVKLLRTLLQIPKARVDGLQCLLVLRDDVSAHLSAGEISDHDQVRVQGPQEPVHDALRPFVRGARGREQPGNLDLALLLRAAAGDDQREQQQREDKTHHLVETSSRRKRSRRPRTLASTRIEPAWRTKPPIRFGSTARFASIFLPDASSIWRRRSRASSSESSRAVVSSTFRRRSSRAIRRSNSRAISSIWPLRPFSATSRRKLRTSSSASPTSSSMIATFVRGSSCGLRSAERSSGTSRTAAAKSASSSLTCCRRPLSFAASNRACA